MSTPPITPTQVNAPIRPPQAEGFLGGVYDVVGPQLAAAQEDERRQRLAEQDFYFQRLHDPNLSVQPGDSPEVADTKRRQLQVALDEYTKRSPKAAKPIVQTLGQLLQHLHGHGPGGVTAAGAPGSQTPVGPSAGASAAPAPPTGAMATPPFVPPGTASAAGAPAAIPPPPQAATPAASAGPAIPPPPSAAPNAADLAATSRAGQTQFDLATKNTAEKNQLAAILASKQQGELAEPGIIRQQLDEISKLPPEQQLPAMMKVEMFPASMLRPVTKLVPNDPAHPEAGAHYESYSPLAAMMQGGAGPAGFEPGTYVGKQTTTTDPFGNVTTSVRKPVAGGAGGGGGSVKGAAGGGGSGAGLGSVTGRVMAVPPPLDSEGHVPMVQGVNPQLIENANQLLDGQDITKLPAKARTGAAALARKYGWEQGKFTPKEQTQVREASTFIQQAMQDSNALSALDGDFLDRAKLSQILSNPDREGFIGRSLTGAAAQSMSPQQTAFVQMYNQLVGTIAGLSKLVRPGGTTEAQIERLKSELPNPVTTKNSADARQRLQRLQKEIDIAMAKGNFSIDAGGGRPSSIPAPPSGGAKKQAYQLNGKWYDAQTHQVIQ